MSSDTSRQSANRSFRRRNLPLLILQARENVIALFRPLLNAHGITEQQWRIVRALLEQGPLEPRQIGEICCLSSPSLAGVLARMDDVGLVNRQRLPNDQRRVSVSLTPKSHALADAMAAEIEAVYTLIEMHVGIDKVEHIYRVLDEWNSLMATLQAEVKTPG